MFLPGFILFSEGLLWIGVFTDIPWGAVLDTGLMVWFYCIFLFISLRLLFISPSPSKETGLWVKWTFCYLSAGLLSILAGENYSYFCSNYLGIFFSNEVKFTEWKTLSEINAEKSTCYHEKLVSFNCALQVSKMSISLSIPFGVILVRSESIFFL